VSAPRAAYYGDKPVLADATKAAAVTNVATADADATYGQTEADLINELKTKLNAALAALRAAGLMET